MLRPLHYGVAFFVIAASGLCLASLLTTEWYTISFTGTDLRLGVYRGCDNGVCDKIEFTDQNIGCNRTAGDMKQRTYAVFGLTIAAGVCGVLSFVATLGSSNRRWAAFIGAALCLLGTQALIASVVLFAFTWHHWYFCDMPYCDNVFVLSGQSGACQSFFGYSYAFVVVGAACFVVASILTLILLCKYLPPASAATPSASAQVENTERVHTNATDIPSQQTDREVSAPAQHTQAPRDHPQTNNHNTADGPLAENRRTSEMRLLTNNTSGNQSLDGWELDANTGLYWSDVEKLFYDPVSGHFYDPESELWYDPATEQWYQGAEQ